MASSNDLIKYFTEEFVRYIDTPRQNRPRKIKEPIAYQWFGFMPLAVKMILQLLNKHIKSFIRFTLNFIVKKVRSLQVKNNN